MTYWNAGHALHRHGDLCSNPATMLKKSPGHAKHAFNPNTLRQMGGRSRSLRKERREGPSSICNPGVGETSESVELDGRPASLAELVSSGSVRNSYVRT